MAKPVVPNQFVVGRTTIVHKPTQATFNFDIGGATFKSVNWERAGEQSQDYRQDDLMRVAQQLFRKLPR
jgi:hypothetical protein